MRSYLQGLSLVASPEIVYAALTTHEGLRGWWTQDCDVPGEVGKTFQVRFGSTYKSLRIEALDLGREVRWICTGAHLDVDQLTRKDEWVGTQIVFRLEPGNDQSTWLQFEHLGLVPTIECFGVCSEGWRRFLTSLQKFVETGLGTPFECPAQAIALNPKQMASNRS